MRLSRLPPDERDSIARGLGNQSQGVGYGLQVKLIFATAVIDINETFRIIIEGSNAFVLTRFLVAPKRIRNVPQALFERLGLLRRSLAYRGRHQ
jgi:hypothetical protein